MIFKKAYKSLVVRSFLLIALLLGTTAQSPVSGPNSIELTSKNSVIFRGVVDQDSVTQAQQEVAKLVKKLPKGSTIYLVLDTPGGSVLAGRQFIDFLNAYAPNYEFKTVTIMAASMGFMMVESLGERLITPSGVMMSHPASVSGLSGELPGTLISRLNFLRLMVEQAEEVVAKRIGMSLKQYQEWNNNEYWSIGEAAVKDNVSDRTVLVRCSEELNNSRVQSELQSFFGSIKLTYSGCPLNRAPLAVSKKGLVFFSSAQEAKFNEFLDLYITKPEKFVSEYITTGKYTEFLR